MKFLTDENVSTKVVNSLRKFNYDVKDIKEEKLYGLSDEKIFELAQKERRIIISHDKDFIRSASLPGKHNGIILLRLKNQKPSNASNILLKVLNSSIKDKLEDNLVVISEDKVIVHH